MSLPQDYLKISSPRIQEELTQDEELLRPGVHARSHRRARQASPSSSDQGEESETPSSHRGYSFADITERFEWLHDDPITIPTFEAKRGKTRKDKYSSHLILIRRKEEKESNGTWSSLGTTLEIRDREIHKALRHILKDIRYINLLGPVLILKQPFRELFWFEKELRASTTSCHGSMETYEGFKALQKHVISGQLNKLRVDYEIQVPSGYVTFDVAWTLYRPNSIVIFEENDTKRAYVVRSLEVPLHPVSPVIEVQCYGWTCDDENFGLYQRQIDVAGFDGTSKILDLNLYPLDCMETTEKERLQCELVSNGKKWQTLLDTCNRMYHGVAHLLQRKSAVQRKEGKGLYESIPIQIESRIILDRDACLRENRESEPSLVTWPVVSRNESLPKSEGMESIWNKYPRTAGYHMSDLQALICPPTVRGFALEDKVWADFRVDVVKEIDWDLEAFKHVQLEERIKVSMESLVRFHEEASNSFKDFVAGKSRGLVILLYGPPGTGKTLTAEALSETTKRPLFRISSGDLGIKTEQAEQELSRAFRLAGRWNAILLLDEADVFLASRSSDLIRNGFVSIFLRTMEWFRGIMLMTTNRREDFDEAFKSRIHMSIEYKAPDVDVRRRIWENIVNEQQASHELTLEAFERLSQDDKLNGREIKNLVRVAVALSKANGQSLNEETVVFARQLVSYSPIMDKSE